MVKYGRCIHDTCSICSCRIDQTLESSCIYLYLIVVATKYAPMNRYKRVFPQVYEFRISVYALHIYHYASAHAQDPENIL